MDHSLLWARLGSIPAFCQHKYGGSRRCVCRHGRNPNNLWEGGFDDGVKRGAGWLGVNHRRAADADNGVGLCDWRIWGTLAVVLTNSDASLGTQIYGIAVVGIFTVVVSAAVWLILKTTLGIRGRPEDEFTGLDSAELGIEAYPDFVR